MQSKRLLYTSSSRDPRMVLPHLRDFYEKAPFGFTAALYYMERDLGWENRRLNFRQTYRAGLVARHLEDFQPSVVYSYGVTAMAPIQARRRHCRWRGPIVHEWDDYYDEIWRANFGRLAGWFMRYYEKRMVCSADYVFTISQYLLNRARGWGKQAWYIPNGCDVPVYDPAQCRIRLAGEFNLVYSGDQAAYKRTYEVVQAMARLPKSIKLYLTGRPYPYLQKYASENVIFLGFLPKNDMWSVMSQADVLVCTADQDCNAKFHEYLRMGKPILAYDGKPNWLFKNRVNAFLTRDYAEAIIELRDSPALRASLAANAARDIPLCTWKEIASMYDVALETVISMHQSRLGAACGAPTANAEAAKAE